MIKIRLHFSTMFAQILPMLVVTLLLGLSTIYVFSKQNILPHSTEQIHRNEIINHAEFVEFPHGTVVRAPFKPHRLCISQPTRLGPILISILKNIQYIDHIQGTQKTICTWTLQIIAVFLYIRQNFHDWLATTKIKRMSDIGLQRHCNTLLPKHKNWKSRCFTSRRYQEQSHKNGISFAIFYSKLRNNTKVISHADRATS